MTDSVRYQAEGKYISKRWWDMVNPARIEEVDAEELISEVVQRAGLKVVQHEPTGPSS